MTAKNKVGLSPRPTFKRVKKLETAGYNIGYGARIDLARPGE